ncbi:MAG: O-antigen ligase family protein [Segetibacter sp.]|nr:O-antigen ligase family protein [Segetibacter sp.]
MYTFLEIVNNIYPAKPAITRPIIIQSLGLLMPVVWASYNALKPVTINRLLNNVKVASVYLAGIVFVAHMTGKINYGMFSNSDSSNGLAPVQLSGYLGFGCILFFLSIMNPEELAKRVLNITVLSVTATVMLLTFSRGGLYFLGAEVAIFLLFNRAKLGNYAKLLVLVPIGLGIYGYVVTQTGGKIVERYEQKGTSNRDVLVNIGFRIFEKHMLFGVGTGNYNTTIVKEKLFKEESGAHNEYVRAAAEHGIFGIFFYWGFHVFLFMEIWARREPQRQYAIYFLLLFFLIIVHNGLKIGIQPLLIMLAVGTPSLLYKIPKNAYDKELQETRVA